MIESKSDNDMVEAVEHLTHFPKSEGSNPASDIDRGKIVKKTGIEKNDKLKKEQIRARKILKKCVGTVFTTHHFLRNLRISPIS
jgi:hypothetical protein